VKLVVTGASGFVAGQILPALQAAGAELLLVGRDPEALARRYPDARVAGYDTLAARARGWDALIHLAVMNNDAPGDLDAFRAANVGHLRATLDAVRAAGIGHVVYASTLHAGAGRSAAPYGRSKAEAEALLAGLSGPAVTILRLAAVHGTEYRGRLAVLDRLPGALRPAAFQVLAALRPTVHADRVAGAVLAAVRDGGGGTRPVTDGQAGNAVFAWTKRLIDLAFVAFVAVFLWWLLLIAWAAVRLSSPGPGIFAQERVGRDGAPFVCYKFRTMRKGTRQAGTHEVSADAVTRVGALLRKTKIDELPQIANIVRGELSLVGPRPCLPVQTALVAARTARGVLSVRPGITGWAQIRDIDMSDPERLAVTDAEYVALRTLPMELRIILATATGGGQGDRVRA